jgi:probable rRNA maturation factor
MSAPSGSPPPGAEVDVEFAVEEGVPAAWDEPRIRQVVELLVKRELEPGRYSIALHLVSDETVRELNREHRGQDVPTDVLSFPLHDPSGMRFVVPPGQPRNLGDVVVAYPRVQAQAEEYGHSPDRELAYLVAHGVLHLLGYDHAEPDDEREMFGLQNRILADYRQSLVDADRAAAQRNVDARVLGAVGLEHPEEPPS